MPKFKSVSGRSNSLRRRNLSNQKSKFIDGEEEKAKGIIRNYIGKILDEKEFSPELLVYMIELLYSIMEIEDKVKTGEIDQASLKDLEYEMRPVIRHFIGDYERILWYKINGHAFEMLNGVMRYIVEKGKDWEDSLYYEYIKDKKEYQKRVEKIDLTKNRMYMEALANLKQFYLKQDDFEDEKEYLIKDYMEREKEDIAVDMFNDLKTTESIYNEDENFKDLLIDYFEELRIEDWYKTYELLVAVETFIMAKNENDKKLMEWLENYTGNFLNRKTLHSEFALFKEIEESIRDLEHHGGLMIRDLLEEAGRGVSDRFFKLLSHYGDPTIEEWRKQINQLLGKQVL